MLINPGAQAPGFLLRNSYGLLIFLFYNKKGVFTLLHYASWYKAYL